MRELYGDRNRDLIQWPAEELPHDGDPALTFDVVFHPDRIRVERTNALGLFPALARRLEAR